MTTEPMKQRWDDVGKSFESLGRVLKNRYSVHPSSEAPSGQAAPDDAPSAEAAQEEKAALREAFDKLMTAAKDFGDRAAGVARDPEVQSQTKEVAHALSSALSATVETIGDEVNGLFKRNKGGSAGDEPTPDKDGG
jgi:hypothetical protein